MAKFYGVVGYVKTMEIKPGIWDAQTIERFYYGDVTRAIGRFEPSNGINDDINISNTISIVADPFANENFQYMRYVELGGAKWKITSVEIQTPRLLLNIGGVYND